MHDDHAHHHHHGPLPTSGRALDLRRVQRHAPLPDRLRDRRDHGHGRRDRARVLRVGHGRAGRRARVPVRLHAHELAAAARGLHGRRGRPDRARHRHGQHRDHGGGRQRDHAPDPRRDGGGAHERALLGQPVGRARRRRRGGLPRQPPADRARARATRSCTRRASTAARRRSTVGRDRGRRRHVRHRRPARRGARRARLRPHRRLDRARPVRALHGARVRAAHLAPAPPHRVSRASRGSAAGPGSLEWTAGVLFVVAIAVGVAAPVLDVADVLEPLDALDSAGVRATGIALFLVGLVGDPLRADRHGRVVAHRRRRGGADRARHDGPVRDRPQPDLRRDAARVARARAARAERRRASPAWSRSCWRSRSRSGSSRSPTSCARTATRTGNTPRRWGGSCRASADSHDLPPDHPRRPRMCVLFRG